jgi:uncharacterized protein with PQ loop repeat
MSTPNGAEDRYRAVLDTRPASNTLWRCLDCLVGGITALLVFLFLLPGLAELTRTLDLLSTTVLVFILLFMWFFLWAIIGAVREQAISIRV